jgi:glycosyltransferase involved in cell wall biosynthesis
MLIADSHEFIELWRGNRDWRMGLEFVKAREDVRYVSFAPDVLSPPDRALHPGKTRLAEVGLPDLPDRAEIRTLPGRVVKFARKEVGGKFGLMRGYGRALERLQPDVVIENPYVWLTPRSYTTHRMAKRLGIPFVYYDPGDDVVVTRQQRLVLPLERPVVNDAFAIVSFNGAGRRRFVGKYGYPAERVRVIPKPVDVARWRPAINRAEAKTALGLPPDAFVVAYIGRLTLMKGSGALAEVAARAAADPATADWRFLFAGGALDSLDDAARYDLPNTLVTGMLPNEELPPVIAAADVVAFPDISRPGGFWSSVAETMAAGKPIVMGARADQDFVPVEDGRTALLVAPSDPDALLAALRRLRSEPALREHLGEAVGRFAAERMDYPCVAKAWLELLDEAVATGRRMAARPRMNCDADHTAGMSGGQAKAGIQSLEAGCAGTEAKASRVLAVQI